MGEYTVTEEEAVLRERQAWEQGWRNHRQYRPGQAPTNYHELAATAYPLPRKRRPYHARLTDGTQWWRNLGVGEPQFQGWDTDHGVLFGRLPDVLAHCQTAGDLREVTKALDYAWEDVPDDG